jgi:hypothetical protein
MAQCNARSRWRARRVTLTSHPLIFTFGCLAAFAGISCRAQFAPVTVGLPTGLLEPKPGLHWGRFDFHGGLSGTVGYDDFVTADTHGQEGDATISISPFGSVETSGPNERSLKMTYRPSYLMFVDHSDLNNLNHNGNFELRFPLNRLTLSLREDVSAASVIVRDIGDRAVQETFATIGTADYVLSHRTTLQANLTYYRYDYGGGDFVGSQQFGQQLFTDYHFSPRTAVGAGVSISEMEVKDAPTQIAEGPLVRFNYLATSQLSVSASAGVEFRQFGTSQPGTTEPVLSLNAAYTVRPQTVLTLDASRTEFASGLNAGQNFVQTTFTAGISQLFLKKFTAVLAAGYTSADYVATESGVNVQRNDNYYFVRGQLDWAVQRSWTVGFFYQYTANNSSNGSFSYNQNVVGLNAGWAF